MKILFAGPSLAGVDVLRMFPGLTVRGPAQQGDVARAVIQGAKAIGLVDGLFETVASVWHKEILFALSEGVEVFGAASIGALRAAECASFGMVGIGLIYQRYASGELDDDAAVAQLHAPAEFGYAPLTEALVNVEATITAVEQLDLISRVEVAALLGAARRIYFKDRTWSWLTGEMEGIVGQRRNAIGEVLVAGRIDVKQRDAEALALHMLATKHEVNARPGFVLSRTHMLEQTIQAIRSSGEPN